MADTETANRVAEAFRLARMGDPDAFAAWVGMVEIPLRRSLRRFARDVDVEMVVQETFLRMWIVACDDAYTIEGENASIKFVFTVARNVAFEEIRRTRRNVPLDPEGLDGVPEGLFNPGLPDPGLRRLIILCIERLPKKLREALLARIRKGELSDRLLADSVRMKLNTFLQNIVRARKLMKACLQRHGVRLEEIRP
jgi:DNA-directed RNA polymerase specialized sigma24 family protein